MTGKNKRNVGIANLEQMNMSNIVKGANLKENNEKQESEEKIITRTLYVPKEYNNKMKEASKNNKIIGSVNSYIIEAVKRRMQQDGLIS